jgi:hypothetical protein
MMTPTKIAFAAALILGSTYMAPAHATQATRHHASAATHPLQSTHARTEPTSCELSPDPCEEGDDWTRAGGSSRP